MFACLISKISVEPRVKFLNRTKEKYNTTSLIFPHLLVELGVENRSIAGVVLMLPDTVDTGEAAVVEDVEGFLESSFRRCS